MQARSSWLDPAREGNEVSADDATCPPASRDRRALDLMILVAPFFLY